MKRLYISMVAAVLGALFIINWGLDKLVAKQGNEHENTELVVYQKLIVFFNMCQFHQIINRRVIGR